MFDSKTFQNGEILFVKTIHKCSQRKFSLLNCTVSSFINYKVCSNYFKLVGKIT